MATRQTLAAAISDVVDIIWGDGTYSPDAVYGLDGTPTRIAAWCGFAPGHSYCRTRVPLRALRRLSRLAHRHGVACQAIDAIIGEREDARRMETRFYSPSRGEYLSIWCDFAQAASPIWVRWGDEDDCEWCGTPFQAADARHSPREACRIVAAWGG